MSDVEAPVSGGLSIEEAVAVLNRDEPDAPAPEAQEAEEPQSEGAASAPEEAEDGAEPPAEDNETDAEPEAVAPAEPPKYWSKDAKERFAQLPPELQAVVLEQEGPREEATAKAKAEAAEEVKAVRAERQQSQVLAEQLGTLLPDVLETFQQRWGEPDWEATIQQYGAEQAAILKARFDKEQAQVQQLAQKTQTAKAQAHQAYVLEQFQVLATLDKELAPDVKDPRKGSEKRQEVTKYLVDAGVDPENVTRISAVELTMARKAMLWDQAQAKAAKPTPTPRPTPQQTRPLARGGASAGPADPQLKAIQTAKRSFAQTRSIEAAVALLNAQGD